MDGMGTSGGRGGELNLSNQALATSARVGSVLTDLCTNGETASCPRARCRLL